MTKYLLQYVVAAILVCMSACQRGETSSLSQEGLSCQNQISEFEKKVQRKEKRFRENAAEICSQVLKLTNRVERLCLFRELGTIVKSIDLENYSREEKDDLSIHFCSVPQYLAYCLIENGAAEEEVGDLIIDGFHKYSELCRAFGDENDMTDGNGQLAKYRRKVAMYKRKEWEYALGFLESTELKYTFSSRSPEAAKRFLERWHKEFGCHNKDCPEWKNLSTNAPKAALTPCPKDK